MRPPALGRPGALPVLSALAEVPPFLTGVLLLFLVAARAAWIPLSGAYTPFAQYDGLWQRLGDILVPA